jgi:MoaA/NifB/PqqE/SkfB family radical SAM enzyme
MCPRKIDFYNGTFDRLMETAKAWNASMVQLIKPKPSGGWLASGTEAYTDKDLSAIKSVVNKYNLDAKYRRYPAISAQIIEESGEMFGCTAGGTDRFYINAKGDVQPCEFLNISFGNIGEEDFDAIYRRMRGQFREPGDCWLCEKYSRNILNIFQENRLKTLPLSKELSKGVYRNWDRGKKTELYDKIENTQRAQRKV